MYISSIQIKNYKGYRDSARLDLNTGINIIVGKNNAGKTALLEALSMKFLANLTHEAYPIQIAQADFHSGLHLNSHEG